MLRADEVDVKAAIIERYGDDDVVQVREVERPTPGPRDLLIEVHAAGVNPLDWKVRSGKTKAVLRYSFPLILGNEAAGVVAEVGAQVEGFEVGDEVCVRIAKDRPGTFAEYLVTDASLAAKKPTSLGMLEAAALPLAGLTAWQCLHDVGRIGEGSRVLVHAGAGGVGGYAIQIAKHAGAHVATTASPRNHDYVRSLGADEPIDYRTQRFDEVLEGYDLVLDGLGGDTLKRSFSVLRRGGTLVTIGGIPEGRTMRSLGRPGLGVLTDLMNLGNHIRAWRGGISYGYWFMRPDGEQLTTLCRMVDDGVLAVNLDEVFSLDDIKAALKRSASGRARGKIVLAIAPALMPSPAND